MGKQYLTDPRANTIEGWMAALAIFAKYVDGGESGKFWMSAEHDIIYVATKPVPLSRKLVDGDYVCEWPEATKEDAEALDRLGFHWTAECDSWAKHT